METLLLILICIFVLIRGDGGSNWPNAITIYYTGKLILAGIGILVLAITVIWFLVAYASLLN